MQLVLDASALVPEALRVRGRDLLRHPALELVISEEALSETSHEIRRRVDRLITQRSMARGDANALLRVALETVDATVEFVPSNIYTPFLEEGRRRIPRDQSDATTVALALAFECSIWTSDYDFFGCGVATWTTQTILLQLSGTPTA